jgi:hypothetical protein
MTRKPAVSTIGPLRTGHPRPSDLNNELSKSVKRQPEDNPALAAH